MFASDQFKYKAIAWLSCSYGKYYHPKRGITNDKGGGTPPFRGRGNSKRFVKLFTDENCHKTVIKL